MLRIEIIGNLGSDPEQRFIGEGVAMTSIRVAVNSRRRGADGESVERTDWFRVRTCGGKAEYVQRFTKGQRVLVISRLEIGEWTTREGETSTSYDIRADDVINLGRSRTAGSCSAASWWLLEQPGADGWRGTRGRTPQPDRAVSELGIDQTTSAVSWCRYTPSFN